MAAIPGSGDAVSGPVESLDRALLVLRALADAGPQGQGLRELSAELGLNKSTVHRTLAGLRFRAFATQDPGTGRYVLGPAATRLGDVYFGAENLPVLLHPALVALSGATDELVHLGVLSGAHVLYLDKVEPERPVRVWSAVGRTAPAVTTALGRALLAFRGTDRALLAAYVRASERPVDTDDVWQALRDARRRGYATEREDNEPGISCVAVPVLRGRAPVAAVSVTAPAERMTAARVRTLHACMRAELPALLPEGLGLP
jgi:DNA-binding IclR family transcriptional regulator